MKIKKFPIPHTRDPFVNTPLIRAGLDPISGEERFWISTWNANVGCLGALVTPSGKSRIYRFEKQEGLICCGAYSAYLTDNDTLWLMSDLQAFVKLDLPTGKYEIYKTGAPSGLVFPCMQYDEKTNKLFAGAFIPPALYAVSFDINTNCAKIFTDFTPASTMRGGFPIGDGTYGFCVHLNESAVYRWNPATDTLTKMAEFDCDNINAMTTIACDSRGRHYIHGKGWMRPDGTFDTDAVCKEALQFFGCIGDTVYGIRDTEVCVWDTKSGALTTLFTAPDHGKYSFTQKGNIIGVSLGGVLTLHNLEGKLLLQVDLDADSPNCVDCMIRIDDEFILGTPFISQRFWLLNAETGKGLDAGRAARGCGEVLQAWTMGDKAYMASYTQGLLAEFDPKKPINFPENPKIVCEPKHSMRPMAHAVIGDDAFYSCNHEYGYLGCEITKYNALSGKAEFLDDPIPGQAITSMCKTPDLDSIICGTTYEADCGTAPPASNDCYIAELCPKTLEIRSKVRTPDGVKRAVVVGNVDAEHMLCEFHIPEDGKKLGLYNRNKRELKLLSGKIGATDELLHAGRDNLFVLFAGGKISLTELCGEDLVARAEILADDKIYRIFVCGGEIYAVTPHDAYIITDAIRDLV